MTSILFLGATGYIGGAFLVALKPTYPNLKISAIVRSPSNFDAIAAAGATPIHGDFSEHEKLADLAQHADIVVNAADSDDAELTMALIKGLKKRKESGKGVGALLHVSGAAVFSMQPGTSKIWDDLSEDDIKSITPSMIHGQVDVPILEASAAGEINAYILCPSVVHGPSSGPVGHASIFFKMYLETVLNEKGPFIVGDGKYRVEIVYIDDVTSLFLLIFAHALSSLTSTPTPTPHLTAYQKYFIASTGVTDWNVISKLVADALSGSDSKKVKDTLTTFEVRRVSADDVGASMPFMTTNVHTRPGRGRTLGWVPNAPALEETIEGDIAAVLEKL